ncbi:hypothetical protein F5X96DRAFT_640358 [Biscogniauxia mediterranea]|nr:hypothetical protein F5X96DRAFT_640358 [Biscogniauxia mediterranea]
MVTLTVTPDNAPGSNPAEHIRVTSPGNHVTVDSGDQSVSVDQDDLFYGDFHQANSQGAEKRSVVFRPQVTVNIHNNTGSRGEVPSAGASATGTGRPDWHGSTIAGRSNAGGSASDDLVSILVSQVAALSRKVDELSSLALVRVENGMWNTNGVRAWDRPQEKTSARINFSKEFKSVPKVMVSMCSADLDKESNFRVAVYPTDVDTRGFTVHANSWADTKIYSCGVSWMAVGE